VLGLLTVCASSRPVQRAQRDPWRATTEAFRDGQAQAEAHAKTVW
jgi:hypothetical protein